MPARPARPVRAAAGLSLVTALLLSGCSGDDGGDAAGASASPTDVSASPTDVSSTAEADPTATAAATVDADTQKMLDEAKAAGIDPDNPPEPIASSTTAATVEDDPKATMKIDLLGLKRQGKTVLATFAFTVTSSGGSEDPEWIYTYLGGTGWHPTLVDTQNLRLHRVVEAQGRRVSTDYQGNKFRPGQTLYAYAMFGAPPEDVTSMDVMPSDTVPAIPNVPLS